MEDLEHMDTKCLHSWPKWLKTDIGIFCEGQGQVLEPFCLLEMLVVRNLAFMHASFFLREVLRYKCRCMHL